MALEQIARFLCPIFLMKAIQLRHSKTMFLFLQPSLVEKGLEKTV